MSTTNGTVEFHANGRGTWRGKTWNGEEWIYWAGVFLTRGKAEQWARARNYSFFFVE